MAYDVAVIGGGIGAAAFVAACKKSAPKARILVLDKATRPGGRLGARTLQLPAGPHEVDIGAAYFTATSEQFKAQVDYWLAKNLVREWTKTLWVFDGNERAASTTGPMRYAARNGLRSLVVDCFDSFAKKFAGTVTYQPQHPVQELTDQYLEDCEVIVFACPTQQALRVIDNTHPLPIAPEQRDELASFKSKPVITAWAAFEQVFWPDFQAAFVNENSTLSLIADDGTRRGDGAPVLVAHSTHEFAAHHESATGCAVELITQATKLLEFSAKPTLISEHRWGLAEPTFTDPREFWFDGKSIAICGDEWGGPSKIETAWLSGTRLGHFVAEEVLA